MLETELGTGGGGGPQAFSCTLGTGPAHVRGVLMNDFILNGTPGVWNCRVLRPRGGGKGAKVVSLGPTSPVLLIC